jgi:adenylyl cyclase-associated protein
MSLDGPSSPKSVGGPSSALPATPEPPKSLPPPPAVPAAAPVPPQIQDFDALIKGDVQNFVTLGEKIGGLVAEQVRFFLEKSFLRLISKISVVANQSNSRKPSSGPSKPSAHIFSLS